MKIGSLDNSAKLAANAAADARKPASAANGGARAAEASTKVELSPAAAAALGAAAPDADFDAEKVARIAQAIRDGRFEVNAEAIADGLLTHARALLAAKPQ